MPLTTQEIAARVSGTLTGPGDVAILGVDGLENAGPRDLTFIRDQRHAAAWAACKAGAVLVGKGVTVEANGRAVIAVADADLAMITVMRMLAPPPVRPAAGVHPAATVDPSAKLGANVAIGAGCYVGPRAAIGDGTVLHPNATVFGEATLGRGCELFSGAVVRDRCRLGDRVVLHPNAVIGADGFGYRSAAELGGRDLIKVPQIGTVEIGDDVEIGACTCVDRARFAVTRIGGGTKIDNLCQIAHNVIIGRACVIAGRSGLAGTVTLGDRVTVGGGVIVKDHVKIGDDAVIAGGSAVMSDVPAGEMWAGYPASEHSVARREYAAVRRLPELMKRLKKQ